MDDPIFSEFVLDAAKIGESGRWAALNEKIVGLAKKTLVGNEWKVELFSAISFQVFSEYLRLKKAHAAESADPSLLAWRARNLLELSVWSTYFARSGETARQLYEDAGRDAMEVLKLFESWGQKTEQPIDWLSTIAGGKNDLTDRAASVGIEDLSGKYMNVSKAAEICGLKEAFAIQNKLLSKFAHPTAIQILGTADDEKLRLQSDMFYGQGCCFSIGAFNALELSIPFI